MIDDADRWLKTAKMKLDNFTKNSENPQFIAFEMLEKKHKTGEDFMEAGETILSQLVGQKDVSVTKVEDMLGELNVKFDSDAIKLMNEICKINLIEGTNTSIDQIPDDDHLKMGAAVNKFTQDSVFTKSSSVASVSGKPLGHVTAGNRVSMKGSVFDEDENDLLLSEDIFPSGSSSTPDGSKRAPVY